MRWLGLLLAAITLFTTPAVAQSIPSAPTGKPTAADEATAKRNFESGLRLYGEGSYAEALIAFEQSYRLGGRASALKNIAQCHRNLKHFVEAYEAYEQMLAKHEAQISAADKKAVQQALEELGVLSATVLVDVSEADAEIEIDGKSAGRSPMTKPKRVAATGGHTFRVTKPGFTHVEQPFTVDSQQNKKIDVKLEVEKTVGHVVVREQNGRDVHVFIDGHDQGPAPWEGELAAGEHTVEAKGARFASESRRITVVQKDRLDLALDAAALQGKLRVTTVPSTANIAVDGNTVGSGAWEGELPEGPHRIEVSLPGQTPQVRDVVLGRGQFVAQEIPIVSAIATSAVPVYQGIFLRFSIFGQLGAGMPNETTDVTSNKGGVTLQGGGALRVGRMWDWWGAEVVALFAFEHRDISYTYNGPPITANTGSTDFGYQSNSPTAFFGIGPRITSKDDTVRFTFGIAPGVGVHEINVHTKDNNNNTGGSTPNNPNGSGSRFVQQTTTGPQTTSGGGPITDEVGSNAGYTAFGFLMDGGMLVGSTPGTKFYLGVQAWVDFAPTLVVGPDTQTPVPNSAFKRPGRGVAAFDGAQLYVGPTLGLQFGH